VDEEPRTTIPTNEAYLLLEPSTVSYRTLAALTKAAAMRKRAVVDVRFVPKADIRAPHIIPHGKAVNAWRCVNCPVVLSWSM
jgi:hypothetical protein